MFAYEETLCLITQLTTCDQFTRPQLMSTQKKQTVCLFEAASVTELNRVGESVEQPDRIATNWSYNLNMYEHGREQTIK